MGGSRKPPTYSFTFLWNVSIRIRTCNASISKDQPQARSPETQISASADTGPKEITEILGTDGSGGHPWSSSSHQKCSCGSLFRETVPLSCPTESSWQFGRMNPCPFDCSHLSESLYFPPEIMAADAADDTALHSPGQPRAIPDQPTTASTLLPPHPG
jgi:hypothetical protein